MLSKDYILGFIEGEGCFSIAIGKYIDRKPRQGKWTSNKKNPRLFRISPSFRITNAEVNLPLLEEIKSTLGFGATYVQKRSEKNPSYSNMAYYYTNSFEEALKVKEYFSPTDFKTTKGKDFVLWGKCLEIIQQKRHNTKEGILQICALRDQMNFRPTKNKWNIDEVKKVLEEKPAHITANINPTQQQLLHNDSSGSENWLGLRKGNFKPRRFVPVES